MLKRFFKVPSNDSDNINFNIHPAICVAGRYLPNPTNLPPDFATLIGCATTTWASVEFALDTLLRVIAKHPMNADKEDASLRKEAFKRRVKRIRRLTGWADVSLQRDLKSILDRSLKLHDCRNLVAHGVWAHLHEASSGSPWQVSSLEFDAQITSKACQIIEIAALHELVSDLSDLLCAVIIVGVKINTAMPPSLRGLIV